MASMLNAPANCISVQPHRPKLSGGAATTRTLNLKQRPAPNKNLMRMMPKMSISAAAPIENPTASSTNKFDIPIMVNGCSGKMGKAIITAAESAGLNVVPFSFGSAQEAGQFIQVGTKEILIHGPSDREATLESIRDKYPNLIVVDSTVPSAVNNNAELYCKVGVPFVMGTTGGDRDRLYKTVEDSKLYAIISPQTGKQVVAFLATMEIMAEQFPGAFSRYSMQLSRDFSTAVAKKDVKVKFAVWNRNCAATSGRAFVTVKASNANLKAVLFPLRSRRQMEFFIGFTKGEMERIDKLVRESGEEVLAKEFCQSIAKSFNRSAGRVGKPIVKWIQVADFILCIFRHARG